MVVGAGRGPLVMAALRAAENLGLDSVILVYALEKNPNAVLTLEVSRTVTGGIFVLLGRALLKPWKICCSPFCRHFTVLNLGATKCKCSKVT